MHTDDETGYEQEPVESFLPLPPDLAATFYRLETSDLSDGAYYRKVLTAHGSRSVVELGCGTGRISEFLAGSGFAVVGIDNVRAMLQESFVTRRAPTVEMDMCRLGLRCCFDAVVIAWNTLNLLGRKSTIATCLKEVGQILTPGGLLLLHLFVPDRHLIEHPGQRFFQFSIHDLPSGGKMIKETLRSYDPDTESLELEERYKLRFLPGNRRNENYRQTHHLAAFPADTWLGLLRSNGFTVLQRHTSFDAPPTHDNDHSALLITARSAT